MDLSSLRVCFPVFAATSLLCAQTPHRHDPSHNHEEEVIPLDEVIVSAPLDRPLYQQAQAASIMASQALTLGQEASLGQTLSRVPGVSSSFFGQAASRPVIRGLDGDRIRVLQNGLNTIDASSASPDHGVSFDVSNLKSLEVVRGPATLLYGSNAIGGVVNAIDGRIVDEKLDAGTIRGSLGSRFSSVDQGYASNFMLEGGLGQGLAFHIEGFTRAAEDFRVPGDLRSQAFQANNPLPPGTPEPSKIAQNSYLRAEGLSGGLSYVWDEGFVGFSWTEYHSRYGSPVDPAVFIDMNQTRLDVRGAFYNLLPKIKELSYRFAWSDYEHTEFEDGEDNTVFKNDGYDFRLEAKHEKVAGLEGVIGFQSDRSSFLLAGSEAFMAPSVTQSHSLFIFEELNPIEKLRFQIGGRYDNINVRSVDNPVVVDAQGDRLGGVVSLNGPVATVLMQVAGHIVSVQAMKSQLLATGSPLYFTTNNCTGTPLVQASAPGVVELSTLAAPGTSVWVGVQNAAPTLVTVAELLKVTFAVEPVTLVLVATLYGPLMLIVAALNTTFAVLIEPLKSRAPLPPICSVPVPENVPIELPVPLRFSVPPLMVTVPSLTNALPKITVFALLWV